MATRTVAHVQIGFANPFLICEECREPVKYWHDENRCGPRCQDGLYNYPCQHVADVISKCPTWDPVEGCSCKQLCKK